MNRECFTCVCYRKGIVYNSYVTSVFNISLLLGIWKIFIKRRETNFSKFKFSINFFRHLIFHYTKSLNKHFKVLKWNHGLVFPLPSSRSRKQWPGECWWRASMYWKTAVFEENCAAEVCPDGWFKSTLDVSVWILSYRRSLTVLTDAHWFAYPILPNEEPSLRAL